MTFRQNEGAFDMPNSLDAINGNEVCSFQIIGAPNLKISLFFDELDLESSSPCSEQSLSIYEGTGGNKTLSEVRCLQNRMQFSSRTNKVTIVLKIKNYYARKIFQLYYIIGSRGIKSFS